MNKAFIDEIQKLAVSIAPIRAGLKRMKARNIVLAREPSAEAALLTGGTSYAPKGVFGPQATITVRRDSPNARAEFLHELGHSIDLTTSLDVASRKYGRRQLNNMFGKLEGERVANRNARLLIKKYSKIPKEDLADFDRSAKSNLRTYKLDIVKALANSKLIAKHGPFSDEISRLLNAAGVIRPDTSRKDTLLSMYKAMKRNSEFREQVRRVSRENKAILSQPHY